MDYACPTLWSSARIHVRRLQVLQSKCLRLATFASWYESNRQIQGDLGVPLFANHIRSLTASFAQSYLKWRNPYYGNSAGTYADRGLTASPDAKSKNGRVPQASRVRRPRWPIRLNESRSALISRAPFGYLDSGFFRDFSSVVRQMSGYRMQSRVTAPLSSPRRGGFT
jgi:hypothetical protein